MPRKILSYITPTDLSGLVSWWKADSLALSDGDPVATWVDSSGNGNDATQATAGNKPTKRDNFSNGKPCVEFDGGDGLVVANESNFDIETPSVFIVASRTSGSGRIMSKSTTGFSDGRRRKLEFLFTDGTTFRAGSGADATGVNTTVTSTSVPAIYGFISSSDTSHRIYYNGTATDSTTTLSESSSNFNNASLLIGSAFSAGTEAITGKIADIIVYNRPLNEYEAYGIMNYLSVFYNITGDTLGGYPRTAVSRRYKLEDFITCLDFDGIDDNASISSASFNVTDNLTVTAWIKPDSFGELNLGTICGKGGGFSGAGFGWGLYLRNNTGQRSMRLAANNTTYQSSSSNIINLGKWQHVAVTFDKNAGSNEILFYVDGAPAGNAAKTTSITSSTDGFIVGNRPGTDTSFDGKIDRLKIYSRTLTANEILDEFCGNPVSTTSLIAQYEFDEGSGTTLTDSSGNGLNCTITGATYSTDVTRKQRTVKT